MVIGDLDNDTRMDIVVINNRTNTISVFFGYGNGSFAGQITYSTSNDSGPYSVAPSDFNNHGYMDIIVLNRNLINFRFLLGLGNSFFSSQRTFFNRQHLFSIGYCLYHLTWYPLLKCPCD